MAQDIGLSELIDQVKRELLDAEDPSSGIPPLFSVDEVSLQLQVTVRKDGHAGVKIWVVDVGGGVGHDDLQGVTVTLSPLLTKEERVRLYRERYPEQWQRIEKAVITATFKGSDEDDLTQTFGS